jgi:hypothetical protein
VVYNQDTLTLLEEIAFGTVNTSNQARQTLRYKFRPIGYDSSADFYVYNHHYKAGDTGTDRNRRQVEAAAARANADALGEGAHIIFAGDFNISSNLETMWTTLRSAGAGQAFDPLNREGVWGNSVAFRDIHTQSPVLTSRFSGQTTGGMDDRFDFQVTTSEMLDGEGLSAIPGTYRAFGNNGTHPFNGELDNASNTAELPAVLTAIANSSDHLPVIVDFQVPAKMQVAVSSTPSQVIQGANVGVTVGVSNVANVVAVNGADELDYTGSTTGALTGSFNGTVLPLAPSQQNQVQLNTSSVGSKTGNINVTSQSQAAASANFLRNVNFDVLAHSNASFQAGLDTDSLTIDFGIVAKGLPSPTRNFSIYNLLSELGVTAGLDIDAIDAFGDISAFDTDLSTLANLTAGADADFSATLNTSTTGTFDLSFSIDVSDVDLPGATAGASLSLSLLARVALGGDANLDGAVTLADVGALQLSFGGPGDWLDGDFNGDGFVTLADLSILQLNFGMNESTMASTVEQLAELRSARIAVVPEVSSAWLFASGVFVLVVARSCGCRRSQRPPMEGLSV